MDGFDRYRCEPFPGVDFFVCTHGQVDICCGKLGIPAYQQARDAYPAVRAWRTSHFGGHRYAPTAWEFPSGYMWAFLDDPAVTSVLERDVHPTRLSDRVRGWTGAAAQVAPLDREGLQRWGWQWLHFPRRGEVLHHDSRERSWDVRLQYRTPEGRAAAYRGTVQVGRDVPVHGCGPRWDELDTTVPEYTLRSLVEEHPVST
ncbi:MAG: sucrase ferredoxin [Dehalococcoidia bacterium]|nr:sucrase ferredoxin [Dehalococcoidia bacterium]